MWVHVCFYTHFLSTLYLCQKKIKVLQTQYLSKFAALSTHTFCPITLESEEYKEIQKKRLMKLIEMEDGLFEINGWLSVGDVKENYRKRKFES